MSARNKQRAFIVMPFGKKKAADGSEIDFDRVYAELIRPAVEAADLIAHRADAERRAGSIHADMFQELLLAELVVADLTIDNPNVWYELGVRDALRASGSVMLFALRDRLPFDVGGQRMQHYTLTDGAPDPRSLEAERAALTVMLQATMQDWRGRRASPVYAQLPNLKEPDWRSLKLGAVNEFWQGLEQWQERVRIAVRQQRPADIMVLADDTPNRVLEFEALRTAADALIRLSRPLFALGVLQRAAELTPDDVKCRQLEAIALGRVGRLDEAREKLNRLADELGSRAKGDGETLGLLARTWKDDWTRSFDAHPQRAADPLAAARDTATTLRPAAEAYAAAFTAAPADYYPGINALTLGRLWEHVAGRKSKLDLDGIAGGVRWAVGCALAGEQNYWALITRAELALLQGEEDAAVDGYGEAAALAYDQRDRFALDSSQADPGAAARPAVPRRNWSPRPWRSWSRPSSSSTAFGRQWPRRRPSRARQGRPVQRSHDRRPQGARAGHGQASPVSCAPRRTPRRPTSGCPRPARRPAPAISASAAARAAATCCSPRPASPAACRSSCVSRSRSSLPARFGHLRRPRPSLGARLRRRRRQGAGGAGDGRRAGTTAQGRRQYDRCNRWMLYTALAHGVTKVSFITLWDGNAGDGPGGTEHMANLVRDLTGRQPIRIDPALL